MVIYLDHSASTPLHPQVHQKLLQVLSTYANPSSLHSLGIEASSLIQEASDIIAKCLNCSPSELHYTSGATMSNNLAIQGFLKARKNGVLVHSTIEHEDIHLLSHSIPHFTAKTDKTGRIDLESLDKTIQAALMNNHSCIVSIQMANGEMGTIQDMKAISEIVHSYPECYLHTDATQYIPFSTVDVQELNIDMLSMSAQKIGGLKGTGLLYVREGTPIAPIIYGEQGLIGGTENVPGISCLGEAFKHLYEDPNENRILSEKRDHLYSKISHLGTLVGLPITSPSRLPNNLNMIFEGIRGEEMVALLSEFGVCVSSGSACSSHSDEPSRVLLALGYAPEQANSSIRFSLGNEVTYEELDQVALYVENALNILRNK